MALSHNQIEAAIESRETHCSDRWLFRPAVRTQIEAITSANDNQESDLAAELMAEFIERFISPEALPCNRSGGVVAESGKADRSLAAYLQEPSVLLRFSGQDYFANLSCVVSREQ